MIKPSTRARYALRAMIELALHEDSGPVLLREIAEAQQISPKYLEQLTIPLRGAGLLQAERGPRGGYELARPATEITAGEVVEAVEGPLDLLECVRSPAACDRSDCCAARGMWSRVSAAMCDVLHQTTLASLRDKQLAAQRESVPSYQI
jgi:Rrf2 family protein